MFSIEPSKAVAPPMRLGKVEGEQAAVGFRRIGQQVADDQQRAVVPAARDLGLQPRAEEGPRRGAVLIAAAWRQHGFALREAGRRDEASAALRRYLDLAPDADDRAFVERELANTGARP